MAAHILIIEDNEMSLALAEYLLRREGYTTSTAVDGGTGVSLALENTADLILCDLDLPSMDGPDVATALRTHADWRAVPIVAFTAASMNEQQRRSLIGTFDGCIAKPIDPGSFSAAITPYLVPTLRASQG